MFFQKKMGDATEQKKIVKLKAGLRNASKHALPIKEFASKIFAQQPIFSS